MSFGLSFSFTGTSSLIARARNVECLSAMRYHEYLLKYESVSLLSISKNMIKVANCHFHVNP